MRLRSDPDHPNPGRPKPLLSDGSRENPIQAGGVSAKEPARSEAVIRATDSKGPFKSSFIWSSQFRRSGWPLFLLLSIATFISYAPCLDGQFVWDDDAWTTHLQKLLGSFPGLTTIWTDVTALQQYYPLTATTFWLDYHFWGFWTLPYHIENVLLHLLACLLFWKLLNRLQVPGAWLACAILGLHPIMVETVGWITERKNVLSLVFFLGALLSYGRFTNFWTPVPSLQPQGKDAKGRRSTYAVAFLLFLSAYLAKATAFCFPAVLLLIYWWKQGRLRFKTDVLPTLPFFCVSIGFGAVTSWLERTHVGAKGPDWDLSFIERCLIAGRALWFYVGKLLWPVDLCFIYPRWRVDVHSPGQWFWPVLTVLVLIGLWAARERIGRGPLTAVLFFVGSLFPLLGFVNGYFMRYSFVCDHWTYLPSLGLIALAAASLTRLAEDLSGQRAFYASSTLVLAAFGILSWHHSRIFSDSETLYRTTLAQNSDADLAHNNLGLFLFHEGQLDEAIAHFERAVQIRPSSAHAHNNLANAYRVTGRPREAAGHYEVSLKLEPGNANTWNNLALLLATCADASMRNGPRAVELARHAQELTANKNPVVLATLAAAYAESGRFAEAVKTAEGAIQLAAQYGNRGLMQALAAQRDLYLRSVPYHETDPAALPGNQP